MDYVKKVENTNGSGTAYVTTAGLNLRESASTSAKKLATIPQGTKIIITEVKNGWGKTTYSGKTGWVSMDYVKKA